MKNAFACCVVLLAAGAFAEPTVSNIHVRQRWPFSAKTDIVYELSGADRPVDISVAAEAAGTPVAIAGASLEGEYLAVGNGRHVLTWDPSANGFDGSVKLLKGLVFSLTPTMEKRYMIVDLDPALPNTVTARISYTNEVVGTGTDAAGGRAWDDVYKTTKMVFRRCPAGEYTMGSPSSEYIRMASEDERRVRISRPFFIGVFELTQKQEELFNEARSYCYFQGCDTRPVDSITWERMKILRNALRVFCGSQMAFDVPTEAQWEYACRASTTTGYYNGDFANTADMKRLGHEIGNVWRSCSHVAYGQSTGNPDVRPEEGGTMPVGSFVPNPWGLYDMIGNVTEICDGWFWPDYDGQKFLVDPVSKEYKGADGFEKRVVRGGGYSYGHTIDNNYFTQTEGRTASRSEIYTWMTSPQAAGISGLRFCAPAD